MSICLNMFLKTSVNNRQAKFWLSVCLSVYDKMIEEYMFVNDCHEKMCQPMQKIQDEVCP
jgi:hypothetical protein